MATSSPVVETVSRKRVITAAEVAQEKSGAMPDCWEYIEGLKPEAWGEHIAYLYRDEPKTSTWPGAPPAYLDKFVGSIDVRPGYTVPMDDAGTIQQAVKEKFGGRVFRMIVKKGRERITECRFTNEAPPKYPDSQNQFAPANPLPNATPQSEANAIASKAIDTVANKDSEAINIAMSALRSTADMLSRQMAAPAAAPNPAPAASSLDSELDRAFKAAMIQKLMAPPPDPVETFLKIKQALGDGNGSSGSGPMNSIMEKFLTVAAEKVFNPPAVAAVTGRTTLLDIGRELVPVLSNVMHEYRLSREADARIAELSRTNPPPNAAQPAVPVAPAQIPAPAVPAAAAPAPANKPQPQPVPAQQPGPNFQWIASRVANIVKNMEYTTDQAVDEVLSFLYNTDERLPGMLLDPQKLNAQLKPGKEGLVQLFQFEPALASCMVNTPRVLEFIDKFIAAAKEAEEQEARLRAAAPANAAPTPAS